jgi:membrane-associated phospholipid phosphatase
MTSFLPDLAHADAAHWARLAGEHALASFVVLLLLLLAGSALAWRVLHRISVPRQASTLPPSLFLAVRTAVGFAIVVVAASVFAELADELGAQDELAAVDHAFTEALRHSVPRPALQLFAAVTRLGDTGTLVALGVVVGLVLIVRRRRWLALGWTIALAGNGLLNVSLKALFRRVRPPHDDGLVLASGFSFPSGHSSGSVVACGMLAYLGVRFLPERWHLAIVLLAATAAAVIGASRAFLRVHFASDVVAGFASGMVWLAVCITSIELTRAYRRRRGP